MFTLSLLYINIRNVRFVLFFMVYSLLYEPDKYVFLCRLCADLTNFLLNEYRKSVILLTILLNRFDKKKSIAISKSTDNSYYLINGVVVLKIEMIKYYGHVRFNMKTKKEVCKHST